MTIAQGATILASDILALPINSGSIAAGVLTLNSGTTSIAISSPAINTGSIASGQIPIGSTPGTLVSTAIGANLTLNSGTLSAIGSVSTIIAGTGLSGGTITSGGTLALGTIAASSVLATGTTAAAPSAVALSSTSFIQSGGVLSTPPIPIGRLSNRVSWRPFLISNTSFATGASGATVSQIVQLESGVTWVCFELSNSIGGSSSYTINNMAVSPTSAYNDGVQPLDMTSTVNNTFWTQVTFNNAGVYKELSAQTAQTPTSAAVVSGGTGYTNGTNVPVVVDGCAGGLPYVLLCTVSGGIITAITSVDPGGGGNPALGPNLGQPCIYCPPNPVTLVDCVTGAQNATANLSPGQTASATIPGNPFTTAANYNLQIGTTYYSDWIPCGYQQQGFRALDGGIGSYLIVRVLLPNSVTSNALQGNGYASIDTPTIAAGGSGYLSGGSGQLAFPVFSGNPLQPAYVMVNITSGVATSIAYLMWGGTYGGYGGDSTFTGVNTNAALITATSSGATLTVSAVSQGFIYPGLWIQGASVPTQIGTTWGFGSGYTGTGGTGTYQLTASPTALSGSQTLSVDPAGTGLTISGNIRLSNPLKTYTFGQSPTISRRSAAWRANGNFVTTSQATMTAAGSVSALGCIAGVIGLGHSRAFTVMEFGDSLQQGIGSDAFCNNAVSLACRALSTPQRPINFINSAKTSSQSETFNERFFQRVAAYKPNCIVFQMMTSNDFIDFSLSSNSDDYGIRQSSIIIQYCIDNNIAIILQCPSPAPTKYTTTTEVFRLNARTLGQRMAAQALVQIFDWPNIVGDSSNPQKYLPWVYSPDNIHPGMPAYIALGLGLTSAGQTIPGSWPLSTSVTLSGGTTTNTVVVPVITLLQNLIGYPGRYQ